MSSGVKIAGLHRQMQKCAVERRILRGKCCHGASIKSRLQEDTLTSNILVNMYCKFGLIDDARRVFDRMPTRSIVSWNSMIAGLVNKGKEGEALSLFSVLHGAGIPQTEYTLSTILSLSSSNPSTFHARQLHSLALKISMAGNVYVGTALLDVYFKSGVPGCARRVFDEMLERSSVTWSSMIAGLVHNRLFEESLQVFRTAQIARTEYTEFTFSIVLTACASLAASSMALQLHSILVKTGLDLNLFVITSMIDVYSRIGRIREAYEVFSEAGRRRTVAVWNAMISGFSRHGCAVETLILVEKMRQSGVLLDEVTYSSALSAMGRSGSVEEARRLFTDLLEDEIVCPNSLHYSCMVDALARAGKTGEAWNLIQTMPFPPTAAMLGSLLGSCKIHGDFVLGKLAADQLFQIEPGNAGNHVLLANIFADRRRWEEAAEARRMMEKSGARKDPGMSWIGIAGR